MEDKARPKTNKVSVSAKRIRGLRKNYRMSQSKLSEESGLSLSLINKYERGERKLSKKSAQKLAIVFDVSAEYLLGETSNPNNKNFVIPRDQLSFGDENTIKRYLALEKEDRAFVRSFIQRLYEIHKSYKTTAK